MMQNTYLDRFYDFHPALETYLLDNQPQYTRTDAVYPKLMRLFKVEI